MSLKKDIVNTSQVQSTNDASIVSKCSMANKKYVQDDFVSHFVDRPKTRASLIHLGYYTRSIIFSRTLINFIQYLSHQEIFSFQIISCGAGFDTMYWRLMEQNLLNKQSVYIEIDYPNVIRRKIALIKQSEKLRSMVNISVMEESEQIIKLNHNYFLLCVDLSDLQTLKSLLKEISINFDEPTLFLAECVITYMRDEHSDALIKWMSQNFKNSGFINYEQIHPEDGFGKVMLKHFSKLQSTLHSVELYPDCSAHEKRYHSLGYNKVLALSEWDALMISTTNDERNHVLGLEQFDEFEEFHMKCVHYIFAIATNGVLSKWLNSISPDKSLTINDPLRPKRQNVKMTRISYNVEVFGHKTCLIDDDTVLLFGGFTHRGRSKKIYKIQCGKTEEISFSGTKQIQFDAIHSSVVSFRLKGKYYICFHGGRRSPNNVWNDGQCILTEYCGSVLREIMISEYDRPTPRYRHSTVCCLSNSMEISVWVFGGRTCDLKVSLPELWEIKISQNINGNFSFHWSLKKPKGPSPIARMSHSAAICSRENAMYITCGLDTLNYNVLNDIWKWSFDLESWMLVEPRNGSLISRYGHSSHIHNNILFLVGGVNTASDCQPGVAVINLNSMLLVEYAIGDCGPDPVLLFNHSSVLQERNDVPQITVHGGGGNCFSFGTYFNKHSYVISI